MLWIHERVGLRFDSARCWRPVGISGIGNGAFDIVVGGSKPTVGQAFGVDCGRAERPRATARPGM